GDGDLDRVGEVLVGDLADGGGHGRGEEGDLALGGCLAEDLLDVFGEAHAEHLVCFVEDEEADVVEAQGAAFEVVLDAAGGADDDVDAVAQGALLGDVGGAAVDGQDADVVHLAGEGLDGVGDLHGELARGGQDEGLDLAEGGVDGGEQREAEGGGLAGSGLGDAGDVAAGEELGDGAGLDGGGGDEAEVVDGGAQGCGQVEVGEGGFVGGGRRGCGRGVLVVPGGVRGLGGGVRGVLGRDQVRGVE